VQEQERLAAALVDVVNAGAVQLDEPMLDGKQLSGHGK